MFRYCVLSIPRTGSTWLNSGIGYTYCRIKNYINLNEFFTPFVNKYVRYELNNDQMIIGVKEDNPIEVSDVTQFINDRAAILFSGNNRQPLVLKYMYWPFDGYEIEDLKILEKMQAHNITIVNINRDPFDSAISLMAAKQTGIIHRWNTSSTGEWWTTTEGRSPTITISDITMSVLDFEAAYVQTLIANQEKEKIANLLGCITVNYNRLRLDCTKNKIPFQLISHSKKLYDIDYSKLITNYDELLEIKNKVETTIDKELSNV